MGIGPYVICDIETTGLSKRFHKITEISAIKVVDGMAVDEFTTLINPQVSIPGYITHLTGIDDRMVRFAPTIEKTIPLFLEFLGPHPFVAHNASFDHGFLEYSSINHLGKKIANDRICTRRLAYRLLPELSSRRLDVLCQFFNVKNTQAHRAKADALAAKEIFEAMLAMLYEREIREKEEILRFQTAPRKKYTARG